VRFCPGRRPSSATNNAGRSGSAAELFPDPAASSAAFVSEVLTKLTRLVTSTVPKDSACPKVVVGMRGVVVVEVVVVVVVVVVACENM